MPQESARMHRYQRLAQKYETLLSSGAFRPGERFPSVRRLSRQERVSAATAVSAIVLLERKGFLHCRSRSGFYVRAASPLPPPRPLRPAIRRTKVSTGDLIVDICRDDFKGATVPLGTAVPDPELLPCRAISRHTMRALREEPALNARYPDADGVRGLREVLAQRAASLGCTFGPDEILITCGAVEAISLALRALTKKGDTVAVESPTYFVILQALHALGLRALEIPCTAEEGPDLNALERAVKRIRIRACFVTPHFQNPLGFLMPEANKGALVKLLAERGIPLIEDDVYSDLAFNAVRPLPLKSFDREGQVIFCSSFSKTLGAGLRVGWVAPGRFYKKLELIKLVTNVTSATLPQLVVESFLRMGSYDRHVRKLAHAFSLQTAAVTQAVTRYFPAGTRISRPQGGFVVWIELPRRVEAQYLYRQALNEGISLAPGPIFSAKGAFRNFIRLSCGNLFTERIEAAIRRIGALAQASLSRRSSMAKG